MHNLSQFLLINGDRRKKKKASRKPKLERLNARKNIDYDFSTTTTTLPHPRSDGSSFRIDGSDVGQLEIICRRLGLESPEDFGIPVSSWEARKIRSTSDLNPRSAVLNFESDLQQPAENDVIRVTSDAVEHTSDAVRVRVSGPSRGGNGIKGVRPPLLSPPSPPISKPLMHHNDAGGCEWDIVRTFPSREGSSAPVDQQGCSLHEGEEEEADVENLYHGACIEYFAKWDIYLPMEDSGTSLLLMAEGGAPGAWVVWISLRRHLRFSGLPPMGLTWQRRCVEVSVLIAWFVSHSSYKQPKIGGYFIAVKEVSLLDQGEQGRQSVLQLEQDASKLYIFLELVTKGSLLSLYRRYHLQDCQVSSYTRQILHGLKYLHDQSVVHRDVKCANILVDANGSVKLADFGLAKATKLNDVKSCKGTAFWMAPEVVNQKSCGYGLAADIWSLGCTVLEMLTRQIPYSPLECMPALFRIGRGIPPPIPNYLSREARDFISQCLHVNPRDRPTATQLLDHPFVRRLLPSDSSVSEQPSKRQT
ncbi:hypothetical protein OSB04_003988 [Centaurea solstitialis]|uniref:Protein kinase domain-containing protein n=1 Tax=Centaurea solstitialis TaxID=347529 RepID=A0AA38WNR0_9ASTR|nr:hypothetical protein OSB04_003988 [Centaurea solstitialis]